jgi:hypothetical protein
LVIIASLSAISKVALISQASKSGLGYRWYTGNNSASPLSSFQLSGRGVLHQSVEDVVQRSGKGLCFISAVSLLAILIVFLL